MTSIEKLPKNYLDQWIKIVEIKENKFLLFSIEKLIQFQIYNKYSQLAYL